MADHDHHTSTGRPGGASRQANKWLFRFCVTADMVLRVIVVVLILTLIVVVAFKMLWPLTGAGS